MKEPKPPLTLPATIGQLSVWKKGGRMYPIEVAISAVYWMGKTKPPSNDVADFRRTLAELKAWLLDATPDLPDGTAEDALFWLREIREATAKANRKARP